MYLDKYKTAYGIIKTYMSAIVIIPSRYASTRFPGKPLQSLMGKPLIQHVYERAGKAAKIKGIFIATDSLEILEAVESFGGKAVMTSERHLSGTDRIADAFLKIQQMYDGIWQQTDIVVNVQGDEPMIMPEMVDDVVELLQDSRASIGTLARKIDRVEDITDPNIVKVVFDMEGFALYFSRSPIPYFRDEWEDLTHLKAIGLSSAVYKHIGIYAYRGEFLQKFTGLPVSQLESIEKLEQLRAIEYGYKIKIATTMYDTIGVDTPEALERVKKCLSISS